DGLAAVFSVFRQERATGERRDAQHAEEIIRRREYARAQRLTAARYRLHSTRVLGNGLEAAVALAHITAVWVGEVHRAALLAHLAQLHDALALRVRQRAQQHGVHDAEDGRAGPDAQRQRNDRNQGEAWLTQQHSRAVAQVLKHLVLQSSWLEPERI